MKRKHIAKYRQGIYKHFGLFFWQKCCGCHKDFRRERGFRFIAGPYHNGEGRWYYLCQDCTPDKEAANEFAIEDKWIPKKPIGPPPPPQIRIIKEGEQPIRS